MTNEQYIKNITVPTKKVDVVLDTDTFNEVDDQFALAYMLRSSDKLNVKAIYAAPFYNDKSNSPKDGMEKSYDEIMRILDLAGCEELKQKVYKGSCTYLNDETTPVASDVVKDLVERSLKYSSENPLYVVAIGAITNIASAILTDPTITERIVVVWLGGHAHSWPDTHEFNMYQDVAAARVVMGSGVPFVQLPCWGVVSGFTISLAELNRFLRGKNALCDFLVDRVENEVKKYVDDIENNTASRIIWDVTAVAWLLNEDECFMYSDKRPVALSDYDNNYEFNEKNRPIEYVYYIKRDALANDLFNKLIQ